MSAVKVLAIPGSLRAGSLNRKLLALAITEAKRLGAEVEVFDLKEVALPIYDGDVEAMGAPAGALDFKERISRAQGLLFATPQYNHGVPGGLKNAIDWASRPLPPLNGQPHPHSRPFAGKLAALMGASPSLGATAYGQLALREVLNVLSVWTMPGELQLAQAYEAFDARGQLKAEPRRKDLAGFIERFIEELKRRG